MLAGRRERQAEAMLAKAFSVIGAGSFSSFGGRTPGMTSGMLRGHSERASVVALAMSWVAKNICEPALRLEDLGGNEIEGTPLREALFPLTRTAPVNSHVTFAALQLMIHGNAWWIAERDRAGVLLRVTMVPQGAISIERVGSEIRRIWVTENGRRKEYAYKDFIHLRTGQDPECPLLGFSPLPSSVRHVIADEEWSVTMELIGQRAGSPVDIISPSSGQAKDITMTGTADKEFLERMKSKFRDTVRGSDRLLPVMLGRAVDVQSTGSISPGIERLAMIPAHRVAAALGISASTLNLPGIDGKLISPSERSAAQRVDTENFLVPLWEIIASGFTESLAPLPGMTGANGVKFVFVYRSVRALSGQVAEKAKWVSLAYESGIIQLNEARQELGFDPVADGDGFVIPKGQDALSLGRMQAFQAMNEVRHVPDRENV
jgi:hypothetical protein